jgi:hypothetical protein
MLKFARNIFYVESAPSVSLFRLVERILPPRRRDTMHTEHFVLREREVRNVAHAFTYRRSKSHVSRGSVFAPFAYRVQKSTSAVDGSLPTYLEVASATSAAMRPHTHILNIEKQGSISTHACRLSRDVHFASYSWARTLSLHAMPPVNVTS